MVFSKDFLTGATCGIAQACRDPLRSTEETSLHFQICHLRTFWGPYGRNDIFIRFQTSSCIYPISTCCAQRLRPSPNSLRSGHAKGRILRQIQRFTWSDAKFKKASIQARHGHLGQSWGTQQRMVAGCTDTVIQCIYIQYNIYIYMLNELPVPSFWFSGHYLSELSATFRGSQPAALIGGIDWIFDPPGWGRTRASSADTARSIKHAHSC